MAITGRFLADFTSFQDAVQKATVSLRGMETGAGTVETKLNKMVDSFSGRRIVQDAELMSQAFEHLASKGIGLTNSELERMGRTANEAIAKLKAGGETVPPGIQKIADAANNIRPPLDQASGSLDKMFGLLKGAAGAFGIAFSVQSITGFVSSVFDAASQVKDLSDRLGLSTDAVQKFKFAAEQGGGTIDDVGASVAFMNKALSEGAKDTYEALKLLGLGFDEVRVQSPEDALLSITDALADIEDPAMRTRLQLELLGKSSAGLGASIAGGFREATEAADIMSTNTIEDLEKAQQAWENLGNKVITVSGNIIAGTMRTVEQATKSWSDFLVFAGNAATMGVGAASALASATAEAATMESAFDKAFNAKHAEQQRALAAALERTKVEAAAAAAAAKSYEQALDKAAAAGVKAYKDHQAHLKEVKDQTDAVNLSVSELVNKRLAELGTRGQQILRLTSDEAVRFGLAMSGNLPVIAGVSRGLEDMWKASATGISAVAPKLDTFKLTLGDLSKALANLSQVAGGSFGALASGFASIISAADTAKQSIETMKSGIKAGFSMDGLLGMSTGIMGVVTAAATAINAIKALWDVFDRNKGRDAVKDFAESFGGFDALHAQLLTLGDAGEALWIKLTQGVGRNNPEQAARVIAEVEAALARQAEEQGNVTAATEEQAQATIETATQAAKALDELGPRLTDNAKQWQDWGGIVTDQIKAIAAAVRALPLPSLTGAAASGVPPLLDGGSARPGGPGGLRVDSTLYLDGKVAATSMANAALGW